MEHPGSFLGNLSTSEDAVTRRNGSTEGWQPGQGVEASPGVVKMGWLVGKGHRLEPINGPL